MKNLNFLNKYRVSLWGTFGDETNGKFLIPRKNKGGFYQVIASTGFDWDHVSVSLLDNNHNIIERCLRWDEMSEIKEIFFEPSESTIEIHPKHNDYVNDHPYVLHMWKPNTKAMPLPTNADNLPDNMTSKDLLSRQNGFYLIKKSENRNWKHVSVSVLNEQCKPLKRFPEWSEMCEIRDIYFSADEAVIQIHSNTDFNDENSFYTLHLWQSLNKELPLPPSILVGFTKKYQKRR